MNVHHAKTHLSKLIAAVESGEDVVIARNGKPAVKLVLVEESKHSRRDLIGSGIGKIWISEDFTSRSIGEAIADLFEGGRDLE